METRVLSLAPEVHLNTVPFLSAVELPGYLASQSGVAWHVGRT